MNDEHDRELLRWLTGGLDPAQQARLEERLAADPELAARRQALERRWSGLELPPPSDPPPGFSTRVTARWRSARAEDAAPLWSLVPAWARATAGIALAAGIALGAGVGALAPALAAEGADPDPVVLASDESLAESYWQLLATEVEAP